MPIEISRRSVVKVALSAAGGLAIGIPFGAARAGAPVSLIAGQARGQELTAWLIIGRDNVVTVRLPVQEMGQGTSTAIAMLVAEELPCAWRDIRVEHASSNRNRRAGGKLYGSLLSISSKGLVDSVTVMQQAGASARERLRRAAAQRWGIDPADCRMDEGQCTSSRPGGRPRTLTYGELAPAAAAIILDAEPAIIAPDQYRLVGKWTPRLDTPSKVDGSAEYGIDVKIPGMVYAAVQSCPEFGGTLGSVDEGEVAKRPGVLAIVRMKDAVAVVADRYWRARSALDALTISWQSGGNSAVDSAALDKQYRDALDGPMVTAKQAGDIDAAFAARGGQRVEALYEVPYLSHAAMEPVNCTVQVRDGRVDAWLGTQAPMEAAGFAARAAQVPVENVHIHGATIGGSFGRRDFNDELIHGVACAKAVDRPVKLIWHREQDIRRDRYRPQAAMRARAMLDPKGRVSALEIRTAVGSIMQSMLGKRPADGLELPAVRVITTHAYQIPNQRVGVLLKNTHVPVHFIRSTGASQNGFFLESFIDELAHAAGQDPFAFRRAMLDRADYRAVLDVMEREGKWSTQLPRGRGRGMAIIDTHGTIAGQVIEVTVADDGTLTVDRVVAVMDCYRVANPNTVHQQIQGAVVFGLNAALHGEITIKDGAPVEGNFDAYRLLGMADTPPVEVHLVPSGGDHWGGVGEPSVAPVAPALCNAIFAATGKRVRRLPVKNVDLRRTA